MQIRLAHPNEVGQICQMMEEARAFLGQAGSDQWQGAYPASEDIFEDVLAGLGYVALVDGEVAAYAAVINGHEEAYDAIYEGKWQHNNYTYISFHRVAVVEKFRGQKIVQTLLQGLIEGQKGPDFRCDTHEKNAVMQHILEKLGFAYCGKVPVDGERLAYQKIKGRFEKSLYQEISEDDRWMLGEKDR